ncbi:O-antigen ligase [Nocardioides sp. Arc9.136]|uniref:O-antigen ligase family protein n=1 Tax=Nocardioides sp. Arc9.136 TaxID=2996826 RepID=UPI0026654116|nr:hypothetical protein [Nocardioides sp. Arc9.136]WKN46988.1 hypothetical protein OSR43_13170 [Nocardioides sp. Arc9.136]
MHPAVLVPPPNAPPVAPPVAPPAGRSTGAARPGRWTGPGWPITVLLAGYPLWWLLGIDAFLPLALAVPMARQLLRGRTVVLPAGLGWYLLFLCWILLGAALLWTDAPSAVPGGGGPSRLLVFGFRLAWYAACAVVLVWVASSRREHLSDGHVRGLLAWLFLVCTAGGIVGLLYPDLEITSLTEALLPGALRENAFVASLVHAEVADVQWVLGRPEPRPKAPFAFTNTWGSVLSLALVFLVALDRRRRPWLRLAIPALLVVAAWPVVYSLNRGLWVSIAIGAVALVVLRAARGDRRAAVGLALAVIVGVGALLASPLGAIYGDRFENQHSNGRRGQLVATTAASVTTGSPVAGFGTTRDVQGSFASISGAATPDCPACGVPPLGTQGQLWLVLFSQGWVGLGLFLTFVALALARTWRCRTTNETVCTFALLFLLVQLPVYDTLGMSLYIVMVAVGLAARERSERAGALPARRRVDDLGRRLRRAAPVVAVAVLLGALAGAAVAAAPEEPEHRARMLILLTPAPVYLSTGPDRVAAGEDYDPPRNITVDTEAALLISERSLRRASAATGVAVTDLREAVAVVAPPNSEVLELSVDLPDPDQAQTAAAEVASSYLREREAFLLQRRDDLVRRLTRELAALDSGVGGSQTQRQGIAREIDYLETSRPKVGEVIRTMPAVRLPDGSEVPVASGAGLGLLAGVVLVRRPPRRPTRRPTQRPTGRGPLHPQHEEERP